MQCKHAWVNGNTPPLLNGQGGRSYVLGDRSERNYLIGALGLYLDANLQRYIHSEKSP
ncbi:MAG: hypothetical protein ACFBSF_00705 [Leptolyngbyaceae cyanobacterium]